MIQPSNIIAVRALNHWRPLFIPTYLSLRLLLRQIPDPKTSYYLEKVLVRKLPIRNLPRYRKFVRFKNHRGPGEIEYRDFFAPSASSAIGEAYTLKILSNMKSFANRPNVFSYRWPVYEREGRSFSYFFSGYQERNNLVTKYINTDPNYVVVVFDIKNFYPSVNREVVCERFNNHLIDLKDNKLREYISSTCLQMVNVAESGIPIGPGLSHVLGNLALEKVDACMRQKIGGRYLRYVDDIFLVLSPKEIKTSELALNEVVRSEGLELHETKYDQMSTHDWIESIHSSKEKMLADRFHEFVQRIRLFLWLKPDKLPPLQKVFAEEGLYMPLKRFSLDAQYGRFHRFIGGILKTSHWGWQQVSRLLSETEESLVYAAHKLCNDFQSILYKIVDLDLPDRGMMRRFRIQRLRFVLNRLLYLLPVEDYKLLLNIAPDIDELFEYRQLVKALVEGNLDHILTIPGPAVSTFASFWHERGDKKLMAYNKKLLDADGSIESVCILSSFGVIDPPKSWVEQLSKSDAELIRFSLMSTPEKRILTDHSFEDEIRTLQLGVSPDEMISIINTRFSDLEALNLDGLLLSKYGSG